MFDLRVTEELRTLIDRCAGHCGLTPSEIFRSVSVAIRRSRKLDVQIENLKSMATAGKERVSIRDFSLPPTITRQQLREELVKHCSRALQCPKLERFITNEGIDYTIIDTEE